MTFPLRFAILGAFQVVGTDTLEDSMVIGELGLDGRVKPCKRCAFPGSHGQGEGYQKMFPADRKCGGGAW